MDNLLIYKEIFNHLPWHVYWLNSNGCFQGCNPQYFNFLKLKEGKELIGEKFLSFMESHKIKVEDIPLAAMGNALFERIYHFPSNRSVKFEVSQFNQSGMTVFYEKEISEFHKPIPILQEKNKDQAEIYLNNLIQLIPASVYWKDVNCVILGGNLFHAQIAGFKSPLEVIGKTEYDFVWKEQAKTIMDADRKIMKSGKSLHLEETVTLEDGKLHTFLTSKAPLRDKNDNVMGIIGVSIDITEKKKMEEELQETKHKLNGMTLVSATIAHELRTPLASLGISVDTFNKIFPRLKQAYLWAIEKQVLPKDEIFVEDVELSYVNKMGEQLESMKSEIRAAFTFIDMSLKNTMSIQHGKKEIFLISQCVDDALNRYPFDLNEKKCVIWEKKADQDFSVKSDKLLLIHVLFNLLKNALYYIAEAGKGVIQISLENGTTCNTLYFKDTGKGISPDILPHIFERFFSRTYHGAGVGLTFCKNFMESIGGDITCESVEGDYTLFILTFPIHLKE